jgi:hypothetical protein
VVWRNTTTGNAWQYEEVSVGVYEWVQIWKQPTIQYDYNPATQNGGATLVPGDLAIDDGTGTDPGVMRYWDGTTWKSIDTFYDNTIAAMPSAPNTTQEAIDALAARISILTKGLSFVGTYDAATDAADFTAASGLTDGALPPAGLTNTDTYVVVTVDGTGTGNAPAVFMDKGDWLVSDGVAWTHLDVSTNVDEFIDLIDTPASYTGAAGAYVRVNSTATALEFVSGSSDTHAIYSATVPTLRPSGAALQAGDRWINSNNMRPFTYTGTAWKLISPVIVSTTAPTETTEGLMWYNPTFATLFVRDNTANAWVGI